VLAEELGLSAPADAERVHKMEASGTIRGYTAILNPESIGYPLTAFVALTLAANSERSRFLAGIEQIPEILECHHVTGDNDYLLKVRCKSTVDLDRLLNEELKTSLGVGHSRTTIVLRTSKETTNLPIAPPVNSQGSISPGNRPANLINKEL
jgi:Lrp/AsnC family leucine-responsive transcriptional regulator